MSSATTKAAETPSLKMADLHPKTSTVTRGKSPFMDATDTMTTTLTADVSAAAQKARLNYASLQAKWTDLEGRQMKTSDIPNNDVIAVKKTPLQTTTPSSAILAANPSTAQAALRSSSPDVVVIAETPPVLSVAVAPVASLSAALAGKTRSSTAAASILPNKPVPPVITLDNSPSVPPDNAPETGAGDAGAADNIGEKVDQPKSARDAVSNLVPAIMEDDVESVAGIR